VNWSEAIAQWLHILFGTFWFGGVLFSNFVLGPTLMRLPSDQLRQFMVPLARQADRVMLPVSIITILLGIVRGTVLGPIGSLGDVTGTDYGVIWLVGLVAAVFTATWGTLNGRRVAAQVAAGVDVREATSAALRNLGIEMLGFLVILTTMILMHYAGEA
jgi:putative copper export protein